jgi:NAD(P)-dependent dehydrogenase (short-subunit alcohol dehydrogenase family)
VTGASRGIGRAIALELADRGFDTVATMRDPGVGASLASEARGRLRVRRLDVTDPSSFDLPDDLRVLVNNAGIDTDYLPVEFAEVDDWRRMFETNVFGVVALTAAAIPTLRANQPSVVCTITSSSIIAAVPFYSAYRASKAAVSAFGDSLRVEVAPFGIRVVEILPGPVDTDMFRLSAGEQAADRFADYRALGRCRGLPAAGTRRPPRRRAEAGGLGRRRCHPRCLRPDALRVRSRFARAARPVATVRRRNRLHHDRPVPARCRAAGAGGPIGRGRLTSRLGRVMPMMRRPRAPRPVASPSRRAPRAVVQR